MPFLRLIPAQAVSNFEPEPERIKPPEIFLRLFMILKMILSVILFRKLRLRLRSKSQSQSQK